MRARTDPREAQKRLGLTKRAGLRGEFALTTFASEVRKLYAEGMAELRDEFGTDASSTVGDAARAELVKSAAVHNGQEVSAKLMDPIYLGDKLVLPGGTLITTRVIAPLA